MGESVPPVNLLGNGPMWYRLACQMPGNVLVQITAYSGIVGPFCKSWLHAFQTMAADPQQLATWLTVHHGGLDAALQHAARHGQLKGAQVLLNRGADVHVGDDLTLRCAAQTGHTEVVRILLDHGADVHAGDDEALRYAAQTGHAEVVRMLLDHGAHM